MEIASGSGSRKGFYFSFDAFLALAVMSASLLVVAQASDGSLGAFKAHSIQYREASLLGQDAMKLASEQTFMSFNNSFRQDLVSDTVMNRDDLDRTVLDGVSLLWAARNFTYAREVTRRYFDRRLPERYEYRLQVNEDGNRTIIYSTGDMPDTPSAVSSISRLVSGHKIDRPSEGFQARARATSFTKNGTRIVSFPAMGNAYKNGKFEVRKEFNLSDIEKIWSGTFYINVEYNSGQSVEQFTINGVQKKTDIEEIYDNGDTLYAKVDVTGELQEGRNSIYLRMKGEASQSQPNEFQPGTMLRVKYRRDGFAPVKRTRRHRRIYFENLTASTPGGEAGIFKVESFELPKGADLVNASIHLDARGISSSSCGYNGWWVDYDWDVKTIFNGEVLDETCASGRFEREYILNESNVDPGTNVFTTYIENYGNTFWGSDEVGIYSDFETSRSSHIDVWYNVSGDNLKFGQIKVTASEKMGGGVEEPKVYEKSFNHGELSGSEVYIAQKYSNTVHLEVDNGTGYTRIFQSPGVRASPTRITVPDDYYSRRSLNRVRLSDSGPDIIKFYPESTFQWTVWAPSQVGYGPLFENRTAAVEDARERLKDALGPFVDATGISQDTLSTGDQPYLWGPASIKLVIWRE
ncbi:MAG: hypothetical protein ABEJ07_00900 [Candidatus Nanohaloarchaea archaeon]